MIYHKLNVHCARARYIAMLEEPGGRVLHQLHQHRRQPLQQPNKSKQFGWRRRSLFWSELCSFPTVQACIIDC